MLGANYDCEGTVRFPQDDGTTKEMQSGGVSNRIHVAGGALESLCQPNTQVDTEITMVASERPLSGIVVLDLTSNVAGPLCGQILVDLGAEVIKVEPKNGESARRILVPSGNGNDFPAYFIPYNRGKQSVALDLKDESDRAELLKIVEKADVFLQGNRPGAFERLGLSPVQINAVNPRCVYASLSAFGGEGELGGRPGVDMIVQAEAGCATGLTGPDGLPMTVGSQIVDTATGHVLAQAILAALLHRERSGVVNRVNVSMYDVACSLQSNHLTRRLNEPQAEEVWEEKNERPAKAVAVVPSGVFRVMDGYIAVSAYVPAHWAKFVTVLGRLDLAEDPRFIDQGSRAKNETALTDILMDEFAKMRLSETVAAMQAEGLMVVPVNTHSDVVRSEMFRHSKMVVKAEMDGELIATLRTPVLYSEFDPPADQRIPTLDEYEI